MQMMERERIYHLVFEEPIKLKEQIISQIEKLGVRAIEGEDSQTLHLMIFLDSWTDTQWLAWQQNINMIREWQTLSDRTRYPTNVGYLQGSS
jgi:hypothetical protein